MMTPAAALVMSDGQREALEVLARSQTAPHRQVQRAQALLLAGEGVANTRIAAQVAVNVATVRAWRARFEKEGLAKLGKVRAGRGRKSNIPQDKIEEIVELTQHSKPDGQTHWSCRTMSAKVGVSPATVQRVWAARGLKPHLVNSFKLSNDPRFEEKLIDVVGLYLAPPDNAIVLCLDEKSSVQALDRTQPSLPLKKGRAATMTHDYKRNGTTTLFAALDVLTGKVIGQCLPRHRHEEFLKFLRTIERETPKGLQVHLICDNYATHVCPESEVMTM
jgi:transposase